MTSNLFGIHRITALSIIYEVCSAIVKYLGPKNLTLLKSVDEIKEKVASAEVKFGMPQANGFIDGTHIPIRRPSKNSQDHFNYKQFFSISVQALCDSQGIFMDVDCRWPGSLHDANVFSKSSLNRKMNTNEVPTMFHTLIEGCPEVPNYVIGDPVYPLTPYCMKEFSNCVNNEQVVFNNLLRGARN